MPKKPPLPTIEQLKQERNSLMINKSNPERLQELKKMIDYFEYGII